MKKIITIALLTLSTLSFHSMSGENPFSMSSSIDVSHSSEFLPADEAFDFDFTQNKNIMTVTFDVAPGYYLYKERIKIKGDKMTLNNISLPEGLDHYDEFFGAQEIFKNKININIDISSISADANLSVAYQGCAEKGLCYPPKVKHISISNLNS